MRSKSSSANNDMDQDTYEQLMQVQISLDELKEKMDYIIDEIDELKRDEEQDQKKRQEKSCENPQTEEQKHTQTPQKCSVNLPGCQGPGFK